MQSADCMLDLFYLRLCLSLTLLSTTLLFFCWFSQLPSIFNLEYWFDQHETFLAYPFQTNHETHKILLESSFIVFFGCYRPTSLVYLTSFVKTLAGSVYFIWFSVSNSLLLLFVLESKCPSNSKRLITHNFEIQSGVCQGCVLSLLHFNVCSETYINSPDYDKSGIERIDLYR